ncbi:hypothetical protein [Leptothermofonsia sp. ETS-13]|uniref:hypothetical protein n=1 Tax=Leptothermofonsia sp. ETS-13 TaxID=3035696 RepID=UPI003BA00F55
MIQASLPTTNAPTGDCTHLPPDSSLAFEVAGKTVLKWANLPLFSQQGERSFLSHSALASMRQLMGIIHRLRSLTLSSQELGADSWQPERPLTPKNLVPYVSEEAYEVLDALEDNTPTDPQLQETREGKAIQLPVPPSYLTVETLAPYLLWGIARSSYLLMQLIEGISIQKREPNEHWVSGMLRLVVLLQGQTPTVQWCFDLATGIPPGALLNGNTLIQLKADRLPMQNHLFSSGEAPSSDAQTGVEVESMPEKRTEQADHWLQELQHQIQAEMPALQSLLAGVSVECLQPGQHWQSAHLQLKLGFEFMPQEAEMSPQPALSFPDLIEAELLEDILIPGSPFGPGSKLSSAQVSIVELPRQALGSATLIRLTDQFTLNRYIQTITQSQLAAAISRLQQNPVSQEGEASLLQVVTEACNAMTRLQNQADWAIAFLQPQLLTNEFIPGLLWQLTRSSYEMTQLLSGIEVQVLQPGSAWTKGILRLLAALNIQAAGVQYNIDLATRQFLINDQNSLHSDTLCQGTILPSLMKQSVSNPVLPQSFQTQTLIHHLLQQIRQTSPEMELLMDGVAIAWLEGNRDWQPGTLTLTIGLEFTSNNGALTQRTPLVIC